MKNVNVTVEEVLENVVIQLEPDSDTVLVNVTNAPSLVEDLINVEISSPANGEALLFNNSTGLWENGTLDGSGDMLSSVYDPIINANTAKITDARYTHTQAIPSASWSINHGLNKFSSVSIVDTSGNIVEGDVQYIDLNNITVTFSASFAGKAYIN